MLNFGCAEMSDGDFLRSFQDQSIAGDRFHHGDHLRLAWLLLDRLSVTAATDAACGGLRAFAHRLGADRHFNETLTRGWMRLLAARNERNFTDFVTAYQVDAAAGDPMYRHWSHELLNSDAARRAWVEPDLAPLPSVAAHRRALAGTRRSAPLHVDAIAPGTAPAPETTQFADDPEDPREAILQLIDTCKRYSARQAAALLQRLRGKLVTARMNVKTPIAAAAPHRTWTATFGRGSGYLLQKIVNGLALSRISPNTLTFAGLIINIIAAFFFGYARGHDAHRMFFYAGLVIIGAGVFDMVDGRVARQTNQVSVFGAFFDSVMDRYSDVALFFGLLVYYARGNRFVYVVLVAFVMTASLMVSYTRARAEALIGACKVGFMERPERIVLVIIGALFDRWGVMAPALWVLATLSTITVIHRIRYTYLETERRKLKSAIL